MAEEGDQKNALPPPPSVPAPLTPVKPTPDAPPEDSAVAQVKNESFMEGKQPGPGGYQSVYEDPSVRPAWACPAPAPVPAPTAPGQENASQEVSVGYVYEPVVTPTPQPVSPAPPLLVAGRSPDPNNVCGLPRVRTEDKESGVPQSEEAKKAITKVCREWVEATKKKTNKEIAKEYQKVKEDPAVRGLTFDNFLKAPARWKRHQTMVVWDRTRVCLRLKEDVEVRKSDFIHANYVTGYYTSQDYILTQGPLVETVADFWGMVWQEGVALIAMLCQCKEPAPAKEKGGKSEGMKVKSAMYWMEEPGGTLDLSQERPMSVKTEQVEMIPEEELDGVEVRLSELRLTREGETRPVFHYQILNWPDQDVPKSPLGVFHLLKLMREKEWALQSTSQIQPFSPLLVHCSAGVGRSGTFVALEQAKYILLESLGDPLELPDLVRRIRKERHFSVQTEQQYFYIYQALLALLKYRGIIHKDTPVPYVPGTAPPPGQANVNNVNKPKAAAAAPAPAPPPPKPKVDARIAARRARQEAINNPKPAAAARGLFGIFKNKKPHEARDEAKAPKKEQIHKEDYPKEPAPPSVEVQRQTSNPTQGPSGSQDAMEVESRSRVVQPPTQPNPQPNPQPPTQPPTQHHPQRPHRPKGARPHRPRPKKSKEI